VRRRQQQQQQQHQEQERGWWQQVLIPSMQHTAHWKTEATKQMLLRLPLPLLLPRLLQQLQAQQPQSWLLCLLQQCQTRAMGLVLRRALPRASAACHHYQLQKTQLRSAPLMLLLRLLSRTEAAAGPACSRPAITVSRLAQQTPMMAMVTI
jgi:hypothetical protein